MFFCPLHRQPNGCRFALILSAAGRHYQNTVTKTVRPVNIFNVPRIEKELQTIAVVWMDGFTPWTLFFAENDDGKKQS